MLSVIVPVYNEGISVNQAFKTIDGILSGELKGEKFEIIFVDDGSEDDSFEYLSQLSKTHPYVRVIKLVTNYGSHMAIRAGLEHAQGDKACFLACDLQDPPGLIPKMIDALQGQIQIVWAVRNTRNDPLISRIPAALFYALARLLVSKKIPPNGASMFLLGSKALKALQLYTERNLTLEGLFLSMGFKQAYVSYDRQSRRYGSSRWTFGKRIKLFADFFVGFSYTPLRLISYTGIVAALLGFIYAIVVVINRLFFSMPITGWSSLMVVVLVMGGLQMIMMGIIGEYIWRNLDETRARPRYMIEEFLNK